METEQALNTLDQVCAEYKGTRQEHVMLQQAMQAVHIECSRIDLPDPSEPEPDKTEPDGNN